MDFTLPWSWSIRACILSWFFLSSSPANVSSLIVLSDLRRFLVTSPKRLVSASSSDSSSRMRVSILIMAFLPPFRALTSASSARVAASLHWASNSFLSFSRFMASSCSQRSSSARRAASTIARAAFSSDSLASLVISSRSLFSWPSSPSSFLLEAVMDWLTLVRSARVSLVSASSCSAAAVANGLEEARALLETADRQRRAAEQELADTNETLADLTNVNQSITASKRKLEGELGQLNADLDEMTNEARLSEDKAARAMVDAARLADELRCEQELAMNLEKDKKLLE